MITFVKLYLVEYIKLETSPSVVVHMRVNLRTKISCTFQQKMLKMDLNDKTVNKRNFKLRLILIVKS